MNNNQDAETIGVRVPADNRIVLAVIGAAIYFLLARASFDWLNSNVFTAPDGWFGNLVKIAWVTLWVIFWVFGWSILHNDEKQVISQGEFGTVWVLGFYTGFLLPEGTYWKFPDWFMRVKPLPATNITTMYPETDLNPTGHTSGPREIRNGVEGGSKVILKAKIAFQWFIHPEHVGKFLNKIKARWDKDIDWAAAQKIQQDSWSGQTLAKIRIGAAKLSYMQVFDDHLETLDADGETKTTDTIIQSLQKDDLLLQNGVLAAMVSVEKVEAGSPELAKALGGEAVEEGELKTQKRDAKTFHEIRKMNFDALVESGWSSSSQRTRDEAHRLAMLQTGKMLAVQPIEVSGDRANRTNLQVNPGQR